METQKKEYRTRHELLTGVKNNGQLENAFPIGQVLIFEDAPYYVVKLWPLYPLTFYISKNASNGNYTVYSKKVIDAEGKVHFQNPIGYAFMPQDLKTHLEIRLRFPAQTLYMSLFPVSS